MSYQSLKRVLGETSLERKCRFLFGACLLVLITASFWWYGSQTEELVREQNRIAGQLLVDQGLMAEHWKGFETRTSPDTATLTPQAEDRGNIQFLPLIKKLVERLRMKGCKWRVLFPTSTNPDQLPRDAFEREVLQRFMGAPSEARASGETPEYAARLSADESEYQYYQPVRAEEFCLLGCHQVALGGSGIDLSTPVPGLGLSTAEAAGDVLAVAQVTIPNERTQRAINLNRAVLLSTAIVTVCLAMIASYLIVRYVIVKPLRHLRDVSDAISRGNTALRAEIRTGDEFESLAVAFNRMLRHLVDAQDELRHVNVDLDGKVDELAQANMRLYEMNLIKSDFLATMSHELRTPLNSILGFSEVLGSIDSLDDKQKRYVRNIQKSGRTLLDMINDILDLAKIESGKMETRLTDFRIEHAVQAQCDMARPLTEKKNIDLEAHVEADLPPLHQDQARVQQVLNNLLSNAIKFTPEGGRITVSARRDVEGSLVLEVSDTGVGIAEEDQQVVFEKFRQGRTVAPSGDTMTREYSGTGLGLSIVKELCKLLGGEISLRSELGKGSTFTVRLPWILREQPRLDAALVESLEQFSRFGHADPS